MALVNAGNHQTEYASPTPKFGYLKTVNLGSVTYSAFDSYLGLQEHKLNVSYDMSIDATTYTINSYVGTVVDLAGALIAALPFPLPIATTVIGMLCVNVGIYIAGGEIKKALSATVSCIRTTYTWYIVDAKNTGHKNSDKSYSYYVNDATGHTGETFKDLGYFPEDWKQKDFGFYLYNKLFATPNPQIVKWEGDFDKSSALNFEIYETDIHKVNKHFGKIHYDIQPVVGARKTEIIDISYDERIQTATYEFKNFMGSIIDMATIIAASQQIDAEKVKTFLQRFVLGSNLTAYANEVKKPFTGTVLCIKTTYIWKLKNVNDTSHTNTFESYYSYINDTSIDMEEKDRHKYTNYQPDKSWESSEFGKYVYSKLFNEYSRLFLMQNLRISIWER